MMSYDDLLELAKARRTIRGFKKDQDVPEELVEKILEVARFAPSGGNSQPWEFIVVRDPVMRERIAELFIKQTADKHEMEIAIRGTAKLTGAGFRNAPVYILVLGDPRVNEAFPIRTREDKGQSHFITGLASATLLIHLAATSLGLASQWVSDSGSPYMSTMLRAWLGIPEALRVYDMVPIGYPVRVPPATPRRPLAELIHRDRYDQGRYRNEEQIKAFIGTATLQGSFGRSSKEAAESGIETR